MREASEAGRPTSRPRERERLYRRGKPVEVDCGYVDNAEGRADVLAKIADI